MSVAAKLVNFLRTGYPETAPPTGYLPVLALLPRRLSDDEVQEIADDLTAHGDMPLDPINIGVAITRITGELPTAGHIDRVKQQLTARSWRGGPSADTAIGLPVECPTRREELQLMALPLVQVDTRPRPMRTGFHAQLRRLTALLAEMCEAAGTQMQDATRALLGADRALADDVILGHDRLEELNRQAEESSLALLALQAPVAGDLRLVVGSLQSAAAAERMGRLALHVAKIACRRSPAPALPKELDGHFAEMSRVAVDLSNTAREAVLSRDPLRANQIHDDDDAMDRLHREIFTVVIERQWPHGVAAAVDVTLLSRFYERFADHAVQIGRRVVFEATGQTHHPRPSDSPQHVTFPDKNRSASSG